MTLIMMTELALCFFAAACLLAVAPGLVKTFLLLTLLIMTGLALFCAKLIVARSLTAATLVAPSLLARRGGRRLRRH